MAAGRWLIFSLLISIPFGCADNRSVESVFPDAGKGRSDHKSDECPAFARIENRFLVQWDDGRITFEEDTEVDQFIDRFVKPNLNKLQRVEFDALIPAPEIQVSQDFEAQFTDSEQWGIEKTSANLAWELGAEGAGSVVAVIDSGVDINHSQLRENIAINEGEIPFNGIDDDFNGYVDDYYGYDFHYNTGNIRDVLGHGTHVAGIIAADHTTGPMLGVAPKAKILPINFMSGEEGGTISNAIRSIEYAAMRNVNVINASWGSGQCSDILRNSIRKLAEKNILFVAASGNEGSNIEISPAYPAAYNLANQITVGASTRRDLTAYFSNYSQKLVHIMAPGDAIFSTMPNNGYASMRGTSMAAPYVSGAAAILIGAAPDASTQKIKDIILSSVDKGLFSATSGGRLNIKSALLQLTEAQSKNHD